MENNNRINIFWHICAINYWRDVVQDQLDSLQESGLLSKCEKVHITFLGENKEDLNWLVSDKIQIKNFSKNLKNYERICLNDLKDWSQQNESYVFYFHSKGVSKPQFRDNIWSWRKMMEYFLVQNHQKCIELLGSHDAIGISLREVGTDAKILNENHKFHFSGNFWWSKTNYLKKIPKIPDIDMSYGGNYWLCERWVLQPWPNVVALELYKPEYYHYYDFHAEDYSNFDWNKLK